MRRRSFLTLTGAGLTALVAPASSAAAAAVATGPRIRVLDTLPGGNGQVHALGRAGLAGGSSANVPVYWTGRTVHRVPFPAGYGFGTGEVRAVNRHGLMAGTVLFPGPGHAVGFSYRRGWRTARILPNSLTANGVNDHGRIVGTGENHTAYVWHRTAVERELPSSSPFAHVTSAVGINNAGTVVGTDTNGAVVWPGGTAGPAQRLMPTELPEGVSYAPAAVDDHGRIVGSAGDFFSDSQYETYWDAPYTADGVRVPGLPGYYDEGYFRAVSPTTGLVVGGAPTSFGSPPGYPPGTAEFWTGTGPIRALPRLQEDGDADAFAAADDGRVGGCAVRDDVLKPVIWTGVR
ncbi:hypothetical protein OG539_24330 [Actinacidiphila glaucinigra]|uniref:hypothetical protein n=1 Tax=Actinacidiphila glaucinigra TaxID=235986 RepID=UPI0032489729